MKNILRFLGVAVAAACLVVIARSRQINNARAELARLETSSAIQASKTPSSSAASADTEAEIARLRADNRDIYKLRGQITQAREKRKVIERMQTENAELSEQIKRIKADPAGNSTGSLPFSNKGQATPDAAVETAFWTMYQGDIESLSRVMPRTSMNLERMPPAARTNSIMMIRALASTIGKLDILEQKLVSPDEAHLTVRITPRKDMRANSTFATRQSTFVLRRTNDVWQVFAGGIFF